MNRFFMIAAAGAITLFAASAQELDLGFAKALEQKASESTSIDLGPEHLKLMLGFAGDMNPELKTLAKSLERVQVKVLQFGQEGAYSLADMESLRSKVKTAEYLPFITRKEKSGFTEILMRKGAKGMRGFVILSAEPKELTIVNIVGDLDLDTLSKLGGKMGIPEIKVDGGDNSGTPKSSTPKKED
jgi:hypothetical protein